MEPEGSLQYSQERNESSQHRPNLSGQYGGCSNGVPPIHFFQAEHRIQFRSRPHAIYGLFEP
jgi:hypothetical protein